MAEGKLPRGPLVPHQRVPDPAAAAARARAGHPGAGRALRARAPASAWAARRWCRPSADIALLVELRLAGQRARAGGGDRARGDPRRRQAARGRAARSARAIAPRRRPHAARRTPAPAARRHRRAPASRRATAAIDRSIDAMAAHIERALQRDARPHRGPVRRRRLLGINPHTLRARMRKLGIDWARYRGTRALTRVSSTSNPISRRPQLRSPRKRTTCCLRRPRATLRTTSRRKISGSKLTQLGTASARAAWSRPAEDAAPGINSLPRGPADSGNDVLAYGARAARVGAGGRRGVLCRAARGRAARAARALHRRLGRRQPHAARRRPERRPRRRCLPRLLDFLNALLARTPALQVHVLSWDFSMIYALERELLSSLKFGWRAHPRLHFALDDHHPRRRLPASEAGRDR